MNIVLVHGIFNTGVVMRRLQRMLQDAGHQCSTPTLSPLMAVWVLFMPLTN